jgi:hypothetical protein
MSKECGMFNFVKKVRERRLERQLKTAKEVRERQLEYRLKRAVLIQNAIMLTMFRHQRKLLGIKDAGPSKLDNAISAAINHMFGKKGDASGFSQDDKDVYTKVVGTIKSDANLYKLILLVLMDISAWSEHSNNKELQSEFPAITDVINLGLKVHPEVLNYFMQDSKLKALAEQFENAYDTGFKNSLLKLFSE